MDMRRSSTSSGAPIICFRWKRVRFIQLQRLFKAKLVRAKWTVSPATNRRVRVYEITRTGSGHLEREISSFDRMLEGI